MVEKTSFSSQTVDGRMDDPATNIQIILINILGTSQLYSLAIDESQDVCETAKLAIFIGGVTKGFEVVEELVDLCPMKGTKTGQYTFDEVKRIMVKFNLSGKPCGITTDGTPAMIGKHKGLTSLKLKSISHEVITHDCIIHQQQMFAKTLEMKHVIEKLFLQSTSLDPGDSITDNSRPFLQR